MVLHNGRDLSSKRWIDKEVAGYLGKSYLMNFFLGIVPRRDVFPEIIKKFLIKVS